MKDIKELKQVFKECYLDTTLCRAEPSFFRKHIFIKIYGEYPYTFNVSPSSSKTPEDEISVPLYDYDPYGQLTPNIIYNVNIEKTREKLQTIQNTVELGGFLFGDNFMIDPASLQIYSMEQNLPTSILDNIVFNARENKLKYVYKTSYGYESKLMDVKTQNVDIKLNYNDNLPHVEITDFINSDDSGIAILYGEAGTGKTSYIRHLIDKNPHRDFYWMDQSAFYEMNNADFIEFICDMKNAIIILEDCEVILKSREDGMNTVLSSILNLSDGMLGDFLNIKFICTFNTNIHNIDKALMRKGRLKMQYEFKKLSREKVQILFDKLNIEDNPTDMPLCEIYNYLEKNKVETQKERKIGF